MCGSPRNYYSPRKPQRIEHWPQGGRVSLNCSVRQSQQGESTLLSPRYIRTGLQSDSHRSTESRHGTKPDQSIQTMMSTLKNFSSHLFYKPFEESKENSYIRNVSYFVCLKMGYYNFSLENPFRFYTITTRTLSVCSLYNASKSVEEARVRRCNQCLV